MILTGSEITKQVNGGNIIIEPFNKDQVNPNSYNYRISNVLLSFDDTTGEWVKHEITDSGFLMEPGKTYLASTLETLGSRKFAMSLIGRSSLGRLGLFLQVSANLGHTGSVHKWTLELVCTRLFKVYPNMKIGQISFWTNMGKLDLYNNVYAKQNRPFPSRIASQV